jgi:hypothetical protein
MGVPKPNLTEKKRGIVVEVSPALHKRLWHLAIDSDRSLQSLAHDMLETGAANAEQPGKK